MKPFICLNGDAAATLDLLPDASVQCCVTSPPYWGLRNYGHEGQIGQEKTPEEYVASLVAVFKEVWRVLKPDGTLWLNLGDSYASAWPCSRISKIGNGSLENGKRENRPARMPGGLKEKDLIGIPWRVAFALQSAGWYLRQDIIWHKPNPMPESVTDRCTKAHEYIFLLTKSTKYFYNADAIAEPLAYGSIARLSQDVENQTGSDRVPGKTNGTMKAVARASWKGSSFDRGKTGEMKATRGKGYSKPYTNGATKDFQTNGAQDASATKARIVDRILAGEILTRNKRSVWTVTTKPFKGAHFATFPRDLITPCILAGSRPGDTVLDPFLGSGTTAEVALANSRQCIGIELNPEYLPLIHKRTAKYLLDTF